MAYIFDLDGTLAETRAETRENRKLLPEKPIMSTVVLYENLAERNECIVVSGRDEKQRKWIEEFLLSCLSEKDRVILNDLPFPKPANHEYKRIVFQKLLDEGETIDWVFDDNILVSSVCHELKIPFFLVQPNNNKNYA